ncbi:RagB/SusD family nutrient uptake outer membrane protein [Flavobacterium pallidum]|uniref:RagB/SusD family nutrient uptake outer membrane protein n=1 Tax=Flavobacterium pallidum TaxID=2172098 RepID=A0A2S1SLN4_9FLAO|nr:RagB/SusD family nutrient uptake outer membrane protein [Flavobacterium pallidum]AWI27315.1 RagB/SusD family nutrient uptake outer membrane protein [Flavobacterium pallidum]
MKNKSIKRLFIVAIAGTMILGSCNDDEFLDKKPEGQAVPGEVTVGGFDAQAFGLYAKFRTQAGIADWTRYWFQSIRSDDAAKGSTSDDAAAFGTIFDAYQYSAVEGFAASNWGGHFNLIFDCNDLIADIEESGDVTEGTLTNKAEASVFRALCYFELRRDYGEVPLVLNRVVNPSDSYKVKSSITDIDAQIVADLQYSIEHLPVSWPAYPGRATKGFATALLGKLYLYQQNWSQALTQFETVMTYGYDLYPDFDELFLQKADNSAESIFEVQFTRIAGQNYSSNYWESQGVRGSSTWDLGWGFNVPTQALVDAFEPGDPRKAATILYSGQDDGDGNVLPGVPPLAQQYWNKKAYTLKSERENFGENKNHWSNIRIIRFADVLLMAAEAANESGQTAVATDYLNRVRARARGNNAGVLPDVVSGDQGTVRAAIKHERRVELAMEGERFYDLVRWGDAVSVLGGLGYQDKNKFYPVPQTVIDESQGIIAQNPNY